MLLQIFSIYDSKAQAFIPPFYSPNEQTAVRAFGDCCIDQTHAFSRNLDDYSLYHLGVFYDVTATIEVSLIPERIMEARTIYNKIIGISPPFPTIHSGPSLHFPES